MRTKKIILNAVSELLPYLILTVVGFVKIRVFINSLGSEYNGYYQFVNQIITYLFLAEAGFGIAVLYKLYKPVAMDDKKTISAIFNGSKKIFRKIGLLIIGLILVLLGLIPIFIDNDKALLTVELTFFLIAVANTIPFIFFSKSYSALLFAEQKNYIYSIITNIVKIIIDVLMIIFVASTSNLIVVGLIIFVGKALEEIIIYFICSRTYSWLDKKQEADVSATKMTNDLIIHQIGDLIVNNTDSIIIMTLIGPVYVSIYSVYNYMVNFIKQFVSKINSGVVMSFGNIFSIEKNEESYKLYKEFKSFNTMTAFAVGINFYLFIRLFVKVWVNDNSYILDSFTIICFTLLAFLGVIVRQYTVLISSNGLFKESRSFPFIVSIINITLTLILIGPLKIAGAILATVIGYIVSIILRVNLVSKRIFPNEKNSHFLKEFIQNFLLFNMLIIIFGFIEPKILLIKASNIMTLLYIAILGFFITLILFFIFYIIDKDFKNVFWKIISNFKRKEKCNESQFK